MSSNMATTALGNTVAPIAALISLPILTYTLGVTGRGEIAAATAPLLLATTAATFGIPEAVTYLVAKSPAALRAAAGRGAILITIAGLMATLVCFSAAGLLSGGDPELAELIMLASLALTPTLLVLVLRACSAGLQRWRLVAYEQALTAVLKLVGIAVLALLGELTPLTAIIVLAVTPVLGGLAYLPLHRSTLHRSTLHRSTLDQSPPRLSPPQRLPPHRLTPRQLTPRPQQGGTAVLEHPPVATARVLSYGSRIWIGSLSGVLLARLDQTIMTPLSGTYQLGLYAVAVSVSDVALILNSAVRDVTFASDASTQDDDRLVASARISGLMSLVIGLIVAAVLPFALPLLFGDDFSPAIPAAFILLAAVVLVIPGSIAGAGLSARGRPGMRSLSLLVACVLNVGALFLLVPTLGAVGAALATLIGNVVASQLNIFCINRVSRIPISEFYGFRRSDLVIISAKMRDALSAIRSHPLQRFGIKS